MGVFWPCRCAYSNVASYRCYYCGKRAPVEVRTLVADSLAAVSRVDVPALQPVGGPMTQQSGAEAPATPQPRLPAQQLAGRL
jgi:hypothetical protein